MTGCGKEVLGRDKGGKEGTEGKGGGSNEKSKSGEVGDGGVYEVLGGFIG